MLKKIYFETDGRQSDQRNGIKTYQNFEYDTETNELTFVDNLMDEIKKINMGKAILKESSTTTPSSSTPSGDTNPEP